MILCHHGLHADETPVAMLALGKKKTHKASLGVLSRCLRDQAVVYDFAESRADDHPRAFL
ncbi:hypothetical protein ASC92_16060 [Variovorax sp. Root411]|nr:hypothetical protein ASC92_16060 [Variovorax sp. Root411]